MIVKFLPNKGNGTCLATMNYLLGKHGNREHAKVLQGDPKLTQQLADSLEFKHKYTVGVLSFEESNLDDRQKREIMADFEKALLCGLKQDQYNICWIEHRDKGRLELNFVIPKIELITGKALNPYFDSVDRKRVNAFKDHTNAKYDLHDPNDPANRQPLTTKYNLPKDKKALQKAITGYLMNEMGQGRVIDRQGVLNAIQSDLGLSVARITPNSISISDPTNENGRNIRLKGEIYADNFRFSQDYSAENERASQNYRTNRTKRIDDTRTILTAEIERKRAFNIKLYQRPPNEPTSEIEHHLSIQKLADDDHWRTVGDNLSHGVGRPMDIQEFKRHESRTSSNTGNHRPNAPATKSIEPIQHTTRREILLHSDQKQESGSICQQKRWVHNQNTQINAMREPTSPVKNKNGSRVPPTPKTRLKRIVEPLNAIQQKRQDFFSNAQQLFERLQHLANRTRTAVKRLTGDHSNAGRADTAINGSQSVFESAERAITGANRQINDTEHQIKQREQQANELIAEQQKTLDRGKGFGFGR